MRTTLPSGVTIMLAGQVLRNFVLNDRSEGILLMHFASVQRRRWRPTRAFTTDQSTSILES